MLVKTDPQVMTAQEAVTWEAFEVQEVQVGTVVTEAEAEKLTEKAPAPKRSSGPESRTDGAN